MQNVINKGAEPTQAQKDLFKELLKETEYNESNDDEPHLQLSFTDAELMNRGSISQVIECLICLRREQRGELDDYLDNSYKQEIRDIVEQDAADRLEER